MRINLFWFPIRLSKKIRGECIAATNSVCLTFWSHHMNSFVTEQMIKYLTFELCLIPFVLLKAVLLLLAVVVYTFNSVTCEAIARELQV